MDARVGAAQACPAGFFHLPLGRLQHPRISELPMPTSPAVANPPTSPTTTSKLPWFLQSLAWREHPSLSLSTAARIAHHLQLDVYIFIWRQGVVATGMTKGWTSDAGWGCILRTGKGLLATALHKVGSEFPCLRFGSSFRFFLPCRPRRQYVRCSLRRFILTGVRCFPTCRFSALAPLPSPSGHAIAFLGAHASAPTFVSATCEWGAGALSRPGAERGSARAVGPGVGLGRAGHFLFALIRAWRG
ncbi:hypothetical protein B0H10DRAFT_1032182 [Mycena sp. CBHHK59/15]|nr:hypothetical protein B0H10DRAFT_1032182 [Mycena sp. CBHHK59/15]